ncbi:MAG: hypothetical protein LWY06_02285 [Firmicutes bacterium]|nr:hypothetical protein [Bacillota bacterium]
MKGKPYLYVLLVFAAFFLAVFSFPGCGSSSGDSGDSNADFTGLWRGNSSSDADNSHQTVVVLMEQSGVNLTGKASDNKTRYTLTGTVTGYNAEITFTSEDGTKVINWAGVMSSDNKHIKGTYLSQEKDGSGDISVAYCGSSSSATLANQYLFEQEFNDPYGGQDNELFIVTKNQLDVIWSVSQGEICSQWMVGIGLDHSKQKYMVKDTMATSGMPYYVILLQDSSSPIENVVRSYSMPFQTMDTRIVPFDDTMGIVHAMEESESASYLYQVDMNSDSIQRYANSTNPNWQTYDSDSKTVAYVFINDDQYEIRTLDATDVNAQPTTIKTFSKSTYKGMPRSLNIQPGLTGYMTYQIFLDGNVEIHHLNMATGADVIVHKHESSSDMTLYPMYQQNGQIGYYTGAHVYEVTTGGDSTQLFKYPSIPESTSAQFFYSW